MIEKSARIIFILIVGFFFARNCLTPLVYDDYVYAFVWRLDESAGGNHYNTLVDLARRVDSFGELIDSQLSHYMTWGGRTIAHCFVQFFVRIGRDWFSVANTIIAALLIVLIAKLAEVRLTRKNLLWIFFGLWLAVPQWFFSTMWLTGSCNYLWTTTLELAFLYCLTRKNISIAAIPLGLTAGWSNEASGIATICMAIFFAVRARRSGELQPRMIASIAAAMIGYALLMAAPGNINRLQIFFPDFRLTAALVLEHFRDGFLDVLIRQSSLLLPIAYCIFERKKNTPPNIIAFTLAAFIVPSAMLFAPFFATYTCFATTAFLLIASTAVIDRIELPTAKMFRAAISILLSIGIASMALSLYADFKLYAQWCDQLEIIERQRGAAVVELPEMHYPQRAMNILGARVMEIYMDRHHIAGVCNEPDEFYTRAFARYYGLHGVRLIDEH